jgi:hypothetical protein
MFTSGPSHGEAIGTYRGEPLYHGSLDASEYRSLLDDNGFAVVAHVVEDPTCGGHTIWLAQRRWVGLAQRVACEQGLDPSTTTEWTASSPPGPQRDE